MTTTAATATITVMMMRNSLCNISMTMIKAKPTKVHGKLKREWATRCSDARSDGYVCRERASLPVI